MVQVVLIVHYKAQSKATSVSSMYKKRGKNDTESGNSDQDRTSASLDDEEEGIVWKGETV